MKKYTKLAIVSVLSSTLAACSSSNDDDPVDLTTSTPTIDGEVSTDDTVIGVEPETSTTDVDTDAVDDQPVETETDIPVDTGSDDSTVEDEATDTGTDDVLADDNTDDDDSSETPVVDDTPITDEVAPETDETTDTDETAPETDETTDTDETVDSDESTNTEDDTTGEDDTDSEITPSGRSSLGNPPVLTDPFANAIPSPTSDDPFGTRFEIDTETAVAGGAPTVPKNLRVELVSNDWAELNWAPSNDDNGVAEYRIYRSDGHVYYLRDNDPELFGSSLDENNGYWETTSFMDCNYTRFDATSHACLINGPSPGDTFSYQVTAVDADGQESPRSNTVTVNYHIESNAEVPNYDDIYKRPGDTFAQDHDLSNTEFFLDKFEMVFEDNFDGPTIDADKWQTSLTWGDTRIINGEQQYFVDTQGQPDFGYDPFKFDNGDLVIEAIRTPDDMLDMLPPVCDEADPTGNERCQFLSGALSSHDKLGFTYGYVEGRMKAGDVAGMLSSFYMYRRYAGTGTNLHSPEIDILEYLGENPFGDEDAFQTYHYADTTHSEEGDHFIRSSPTMIHKNETGERYSDDYHTFGVLWEPQLVIWYIDGKEIKRISGPQVSRQQMNIVTYLVAGSAWAPTPADDDSLYPLQYRIDYIRAYQRPEYAFSPFGVYPEQ